MDGCSLQSRRHVRREWRSWRATTSAGWLRGRTSSPCPSRAATRSALAGVERRDQCLVSRIDHLAAHLERGRQFTTVDRERAVEQPHLLRRLVLGQARESSQHFLLHFRAHGGLFEQLLQSGIDDLLRGSPRLELLEVGYDEYHRVSAPVANEHRLGDELALLDLVLDWLRRDVLSPRRDEQILLAIGDAEKAVLQRANVAGVQPAVGINGGARVVGPVEVALHDVGAARENLAVRRNLHFNAGDGTPDRTQPKVLG